MAYPLINGGIFMTLLKPPMGCAPLFCDNCPAINCVSLESVTYSASITNGGPYTPSPAVGISLTMGGGNPVDVVIPTKVTSI